MEYCFTWSFSSDLACSEKQTEGMDDEPFPPPLLSSPLLSSYPEFESSLCVSWDTSSKIISSQASSLPSSPCLFFISYPSVFHSSLPRPVASLSVPHAVWWKASQVEKEDPDMEIKCCISTYLPALKAGEVKLVSHSCEDKTCECVWEREREWVFWNNYKRW